MLLSNTANLITQGTSYTINNIEEITNTTTATNHGQETADAIPIRSDLTNGPYIHNPEMKLPQYKVTSNCEAALAVTFDKRTVSEAPYSPTSH